MTLSLSAMTASLLFSGDAAPAATLAPAPAAAPAGALEASAPEAAAPEAVAPEADSRSVTVDVREAADAADIELAAEACPSEMSFCDLAGSVVPSDSASQVFSPRRAEELRVFSPRQTCQNLEELHATLGFSDHAFAAWKRECEREEAGARVQRKHDLLVARLLREHAAREEASAASEASGEVGLRQLAAGVRNIERSLAQLHAHLGTSFVEGRGQALRKPAAAGATPDAPQSFQISTNANAPNMNQQNATGGRGRGRRHANVG